MQEQGIGVVQGGAVVDFDMSAALAELVRMKIVTQNEAQGTICAVPIETAVNALSIRNYPEDAAEMPYLSGGRRASRLDWTKRPDSLRSQLQKVSWMTDGMIYSSSP